MNRQYHLIIKMFIYIYIYDILFPFLFPLSFARTSMVQRFHRDLRLPRFLVETERRKGADSPLDRVKSKRVKLVGGVRREVVRALSILITLAPRFRGFAQVCLITMPDIVVCVEVRGTRQVETVLTRGIIRRDANSWSGTTVSLCSALKREDQRDVCPFFFFFQSSIQFSCHTLFCRAKKNR